VTSTVRAIILKHAGAATMPVHQPTVLGRISIALLVIIVCVPTGFLLVLGTWGTILVPLVVAFYATPLFLLHYVVWGRAVSRKLRAAAIPADER
jgi:hypothetical protein